MAAQIFSIQNRPAEMAINNTALNTYDTRNRNLAAVFEAIREGKDLSRTEIARSMPFSLQTMTNVTQELIGMGLVEEVARPGTGRKGNPHTGLRVVPARFCALGAQIRWNRCFMTLVDSNYGIIAEKSVPVASFAPELYLDEVIGALRAFLAEHSRNEVWVAGISAPLPLGAPNVPPHDLEHRETWIDQSWSAQFWQFYTADRLQARLAQGLDLPVMVTNNPQSAALAEALLVPPHARFIYLMLGLGLGAAFVDAHAVSRDIWRHGGELGHVVLQGQPLNRVLSTSGVRLALGLEQPQGEFEPFIEQAVAEGAPALEGWLDQASGLLGFIVNFIENATWPDGIVVGGFLPTGLLEQLLARTQPLTPSVVGPDDQAGRTLPRLSIARRGAQSIPFGAAVRVLSSRSNPGFADLLGRKRQST